MLSRDYRAVLDQYFGPGTEGNILRIGFAADFAAAGQRAAGTLGRSVSFANPDASWNYRTATVDRNGRPLPRGAIGWTPEGIPYWGTSQNMGPEADKTLLGRVGLAVGPVTSDFVEWAKGIGYRWDSYDPNPDKPPSVFQRAGQLAKELLTGFGEGWSAIFSRPLETGIGLMEGVQAAGEESPLPDIENGLRAVLPHGWFTEYALNLNPLLWVYNSARMFTSPISAPEKERLLTANLAASRIAYSAWKDPSLRQEYIRRYLGGEDPYLLAKEMQRPFAEMWGQMILDPTNAIMLAGFIGKFSHFGKAVKTAEAVALPKETRVLLDALKGAQTEAQAIEAGERLIQK